MTPDKAERQRRQVTIDAPPEPYAARPLADRPCPWCDEAVEDDDGIDWCGRYDVTYHTQCHYDADCRCRP